MDWVKAIHLWSLAMWAGGLLALTALTDEDLPLEPRAARAMRRLYFGVCAPGAFLTLLTGIWQLHQRSDLLRQPFMHAKLAAVLLFFVVDHLMMRRVKRPDRAPRPAVLYRLLPVLTWVLLGAIVALVVVRPWLRMAA